MSWAIGFAAVVSLALVGTETWQMWQVRQATLRNAKNATASLAQAISLQAQTTLKTADTVVTSIRERIETDGLGPEAIDRLYGLMTSLAKALPAIHEMGVTDAQGNAIVKSLVRNPAGMNYKERDYFGFLSAHDTRAVFVGEPVKSKVDGSLNITISCRINDAQGHFNGTVVSSVSMEFFRKMFESVEGTSGASIALISADGTVLARSDASFGEKEFEAVSAAGDALEYFSSTDRVLRVGSYSRLPNYPLVVVVAEDSAAVLAHWRAQALGHGVVLTFLLVAIGVLGWRVDRTARATRMQALRDTLTGLANRRSLNEALDVEFRRAARRGLPISCLMADIDLFKNFNDAYGHQAGDECLVAVASAIRAVISRPGDLVARYGGEEIAVLLPDTDGAGALRIAMAIHRAVTALRMPHESSPHGIVTVSVGVATCPCATASETWQALLHAADMALYAAKAGGRNAVREHVPAHAPHEPQGDHAAAQI